MEPYVPQALPPPSLDLARIIRKIGPANAALARYDGLLKERRTALISAAVTGKIDVRELA
jgi:hypothetical protein